MRLTICHPAALLAIRGFEGRWAYADYRIDEYERVRATLSGTALPLCSSQEFQHAVADSRDEIAAWVDANLVGCGADEVLLTPLSRNPFFPLFGRLVWAKVVSSALTSRASDVLVVTGSQGLARTLELSARSASIACERVGTVRFVLTAAKQRMRSLLKLFRDLTHAAARAMLARLMLGDAQIDRLGGVDVLIDTYLYPTDVASDGKVMHRYYPGLVDWYLAHGRTPAYLPVLFRVPLLRLPAFYRGYRNSRYLFAPPELFYGMIDIWRGVAQVAKRARAGVRLRQRHIFQVDVSPLVADYAFATAVEGLPQMLTRRVPLGLARRGLRPRWLLDWFENQSIDQATSIGFREAMPECRVIAMRLYAQYSSNLLSFQVTEREMREGLVPTEHWLGGKAWLGVATTYDAQGRYKIVPNLRSAYLHKQEAPSDEGADLVVLLTHTLHDSLQVLALIERLLPMLESRFPVLRIKTHPSLGATCLRGSGGDRCPALWASRRVVWDDSGIGVLMAKAHLVISAGTSSAIEAVAAGVPVVAVATQVGIDMCPLEFVDTRMWRLVHDADELKGVISDWSPSHPLSKAERIELGRAIMRDCYEPVTEASMEGFSLE